MSMNSHIRSFIHQHYSSLKTASDGRTYPAGSHGGDGVKTHRKSPSEEHPEKSDSSTQSKFQCIKSKREAQGSKVGPRMFPLNQCTNFALHDTKHSVRVSVKFAVQDYTANSRLMLSRDDHDNSYAEDIDTSIHTTDPAVAEFDELSESLDHGSDMELASSPLDNQPLRQYMDANIYDFGGVGSSDQGEARGSSESVNSMPSISSLKPESHSEDSASIARFNNMLNEKMSQYLSEKFAQAHSRKALTDAEEKSEAEAIEGAVIFCTNLFLQEFKSSDPAVICEEFKELKECGELKELLHDIFQDLTEKIENSKFDQFQDFVIESITFNRALQKTTNPEIYDKFLGIWALNNEAFLEIDLEILLTYCDSGQERQFSYFTSAERFYNELEEAAVRMNLVKFFYTYKWELMKQRKKRIDKRKILNDLDHMQDLLSIGIDKYLNDLQHQLGHLSLREEAVRNVPESHRRDSGDNDMNVPLFSSSKKKKSLRFTDEVCVG